MRAAVAFLTPLGRPTTPTPASLGWFPLVGAVLGLVLGGAWWLAAGLWPPLAAAAVVVTLDLALTGALHVDGLADSADGLLAHGIERSRRLALMAEADVGAFAVTVVAVVLLLRTTMLAALAPSPLLLGALWSASRTAMAVIAGTLAYARPAGLASSFLGAPVVPVAMGGSVLALALAGAAGLAAVGAVVAGGAAAAGVAALARRRLGGFTGDVLGAAGVVAETTGLLVAAARW